MKKRPAFLTALGILLVSILFTAPASADKRVALIIGNGAYQKVPALPNPPNDAKDIAASLERLGFKVKQISNGSFETMRRGLIDFGIETRGSDIAVVFYAGHGMEVGGENWLIPTDAELVSDATIDQEAIGLRSIVLMVSNASKLGLVMLDACRNNPFAAKMQRSLRTRAVEQGLARVEPTGSVLVAYAARDGTTAADGAGRNSPFTGALLRNLETPGLEINFLFRNVRDDVIATTKREQEPFVYGSLSRNTIFLREPQFNASGQPTVQADEVAWSFLRSTEDADALQRFVREYPDSSRRKEAEQRIAEIAQSPKGRTTPKSAFQSCFKMNGKQICEQN
jgi:uncharacterized caspase-like protein